MKRKLAAAGVLLFILCFFCGCLREAAPTGASSTLPSTESASSSAPVAESASVSESGTETDVSAEGESTSSYAVIPSTETTAGYTTAYATESTAPSTTAATTAANDAVQSTRKSLAERFRELRENRANPLDEPDPAFFDDAVLIGDSVTMGLRNYTTLQRNRGNECLGAAEFLCCGSMSYTNALQPVGPDSMHPTYKGSKVTIEDGVRLCGAKKAFIMLGMNDFAGYGESTWKNSVTSILDRIMDQNPSVSIYVQSVTPIMNGMEHGNFTNERVQYFNAYLQQVCRERGYTYVDIYHVLADETGHLNSSYCGDPEGMGIHMNNTGSAAWSDYLQKTFCGTED
ncbi:MAG: hypothetical protein IJT44_04885 [Clostridia bacterium]|nr:hypothetical protein [Clostridia bacterium]